MAISVTSQEKEILSNVSIPPRPQALLKIAQEAKKTEPNVRFIADTISEDAAIASAVLQVVNSAAFARVNKINSIQQAVMILGIKRIFPLVKAVALKSALPANNNLREFWQSSSLVASACTLFCQALNKPELTDNAYMLGLFHNAGIPLMLQSFNDYQQVLAQGVEQGWHDIPELERIKFKTTHTTLGALLGQQWSLPKAMIQVIYYYQDVDGIFESDELNRVSLYLLAILKLARSAVDGIINDEMNSPEWLAVEEGIAEFLDMDSIQLSDIRETVINQLAHQQNTIN
jgi:HD-like signal output (HDOD) protein